MIEAVRDAFRTIPGDKLKALYEQATADLPVEAERLIVEAEGEYNAIGLPVVPYGVVMVKDAVGDVPYRVVGQQVVADRRFVAPVEIRYVTVEERKRWEATVVEHVRKGLAEK